MMHDEVSEPWWAGRGIPCFRVLPLHVHIIILSLFLMLPVFPFAVPIVLQQIIVFDFSDSWHEQSQARS